MHLATRPKYIKQKLIERGIDETIILLGDFNIFLVGTDRSNNQVNRGNPTNIFSSTPNKERIYINLKTTRVILSELQKLLSCRAVSLTARQLNF